MDFRPLHGCLCLASWSAIAQTSLYDSGLLPLNPPQSWLTNDHSADEWDRSRFNDSGTRGRLGPGARPARRVQAGNVWRVRQSILDELC